MGFLHRFVLGVALACGAAILLTPAYAQKRVALVIGNDRYAHLPMLRNAVADARAIGQVLEELGFRVFKGENVDFRATNRLHADFEAAIAPGDTTFVFFAGHGVALGAENYLLPTDLPKPRAGEENLVRTESHGVDTLVRRIQSKGALASFFVIDACRDNPFEQVGVRSIGGTRGLARVDAPTGVFVLFSAGIGQTALDRLSDNDRSPNSIFTRTLVPLLRQQGLSHLMLAKRVQTEVRELALSVRHPQQPAFYDQIIGEVVFKPAPQPVPPAPQVAIAAVIGPPDAVSRQLSADVAKAIEDQRIAVGSGPSDAANYTLRGYVLAARDKSTTKVTYIWDVTDGTGNRIHRITGEELVAGESRDPWAVVTPQVVQAIATKVAAALGTWAARGSR